MKPITAELKNGDIFINGGLITLSNGVEICMPTVAAKRLVEMLNAFDIDQQEGPWRVVKDGDGIEIHLMSGDVKLLSLPNYDIKPLLKQIVRDHNREDGGVARGLLDRIIKFKDGVPETMLHAVHPKQFNAELCEIIVNELTDIITEAESQLSDAKPFDPELMDEGLVRITAKLIESQLRSNEGQSAHDVQVTINMLDALRVKLKAGRE